MIIAGEVSGDIHGAGLIKYLRKENEKIDFFGIGGSKMLNEKFRNYFLLETLQSNGLIELIHHLPRLYKTLKKMCKVMEKERPDALILIDYPGFNLKLATYAKKIGIPVIFFNSPQIWAWRKGRLNTIRKVVDKMIVLFPFEENIYKQAGVDVSWIGHPLLDQKLNKNRLNSFFNQFGLKKDQPIFVLAPGSRPSELRRHLPTIIEALPYIQNSSEKLQFILPLAESLNLKEVKKIIISSEVPIKIIKDHFFESIHVCDTAIVASGTASLQVGLALKPFIIIYKVSPLTFWIASNLSKTKYIGMVNVLAKKEIVPELLQNDFNVKNIVEESIRILHEKDYRVRMISELQKIRTKLGEEGAYPRAANSIKKFLKNKIDKKNLFSKSRIN
tara:strand:+ start:69 stop:1232 length:1164 start_codon:yes stop_codon:yes gene_type:complete